VSSDEGDCIKRLLGLQGQGNVTVRGRSVIESRGRRYLLGVADTVSHTAVLITHHTVQTRSYCRNANGRSNSGQVTAVRYWWSASVGPIARSLIGRATVLRSRRRRLLLVVVGGGVLGSRRLVPCCVVLLAPAFVVSRPLHQNNPRQIVEKENPDPAGHSVRPRRAKKPVDDNDREDDHDHVVDKRKQQVIGDERNRIGRGWQDLRNQQKEHDERQQHRNAHGHLLTCIGREIKHTYAEERDKNARNDKIDRVEQRLAPDANEVRDGGDIVLAVSMSHLRLLSRAPDDVPRSAWNVVTQVRL